MNSRRDPIRNVQWARPGQTILAASLTLALVACATAPSFEVAESKGRINVADTPVVLPGKPVTMAGRDFRPGQQVELSYGGASLGQVTVAADGTFRTQFNVPATAEPGSYSLVASISKPAGSMLVPLKISPDVPLSGQALFDAQFKPLVPGLYQAAYSEKSDHVFVTSAGRSGSSLLKINAQTMAIEQRVTPALVPASPARPAAAGAPQQAAVYAVYGVDIDDTNGTIWTTNTRQNTVAVYRQSDLGLIKQFEPGVAPHSRDVVVDEVQGKAYVATIGQPRVVVFDAKNPALRKSIDIASSLRGPTAKDFSSFAMTVDEGSSRLFVVSLSTNEVATIDTKTDTTLKVSRLEGSVTPTGVAYDPKSDRLFVASQGSDNLVIVDAKTGKTVHNVKVGAGALSATFEPVHSLIYVSSRAAGTVTVVDMNGKIVANISGGTYPNHAVPDGKGAVFAVNKARGENDEAGDRIGRIVPR